MYDNVSDRFVPAELPDYVFANDRIDYVHNRDSLNAAYEILERGIDEERWGDEVAIRVVASDEYLTYSDLRDRVNRFAGGLRALGVQPGDRVFWRFNSCVEAYVTQLATWKIGAVNVPSSPAESTREVEFFLKDTEASVAVTSAEWVDAVTEVRSAVPSVEHVVVAGSTKAGEHSFNALLEYGDSYTSHAETKPTDLASIFYTGGTTGRPKGCMHSHAAEVVVTDIECGDGRALTEDDVLFTFAPIGHAFGNGERINFPLRFGSEVVLATKPEPQVIPDIVTEYGVTVLTLNGTVLRMIERDAEIGELDFSSVRLPLALMLSDETFDLWCEEVSVEWLNPFGMTPMRHIFLSPYRDGERISPGVSLGKPYSGYEIKLTEVDDPGHDPSRLVECGDIGRMLVRGPTSTTYWNNVHPSMPERMAQDTCDGWAVHDDLITCDDDGSFYIHGRLDDMIMSGGHNIPPADVEETLVQNKKIHEAAVVGVPDEVRNEVVKAFVVLRPDIEGTMELKDEIQAFAKENMAKYKYPRVIQFLDELPKDDVGKVQYSDLRQKL